MFKHPKTNAASLQPVQKFKSFSVMSRICTLAMLTVLPLIPGPTIQTNAQHSSAKLVKTSCDTGQYDVGNCSSVYYLAEDGKRYVFPNEKTYKSWYDDFLGVLTVTQTELSTYSLGGNVTYRPGVRLLKIPTDPKVYAVDEGGVLRWVQSEEIARSLYGDTWSQFVDDLSPAFFANYLVGGDIRNRSEYDKEGAINNSQSIDVDKGIAVAPNTRVPLAYPGIGGVPRTSGNTPSSNAGAASNDTTVPTVSLTEPTASQTVHRNVTISATATDDTEVAGVRFKLDTNTDIGSEDTSSPFSITWDSTSVADGEHTLLAVARDAAGNHATSSAIAISIANDTATSSITQYGITWTFDDYYQYGQFESGDYFVIGPVTISSVSPGWDGTTNGTMIDPVPLEDQGYDSRSLYTYSDSNRATFPLSVSATSSVVSTIGLAECASGGAAECLDTAAVLTVVSYRVPSTAFRPPYVAGDKPLWTTSQVDYSLLPGLAVPNGYSAMDLSGGTYMQRVWLDHGPKVSGAEIHPQSNMPPYGRDLSTSASQMAMHALLDIPEAEDIANRLIQNGIDQYEVSLSNEDAWIARGGHNWGRKWPILFAGLMLNDAAMQTPDQYVTGDSGHLKFSEDGHTYYGAATGEYPGGKPLWGYDCTIEGINSPWFGNHDCRDPDGVLEPQNMTNGGSYQELISKTSVGAALAAYRMSATSTWNHAAFFDYIDRWVNEPQLWTASSTASQQDYYGYGGDGNGLMKAMWDTYRDITAPALSSPTASSTSATTADLSVSTDEDDGVLYWVVTTSSTGPTKTQVKTGLDHLGSAAIDNGSTAITSTGLQNASSTGLIAETTYYTHFMHEDAGTNQSDVVSTTAFITPETDITAPTLTSPVDNANGSDAGTGSVSTNEGNGILYWVVTSSANSPSAAQVKAGLDHLGSAATDNGSQAVSGTGIQSITGGFTGLSSETTYYAHYMHEDTSANQSAVASADGFTTEAADVELASNWAFTGSATGWTLGTGWSYGTDRVSYSAGDVNEKLEQTIDVASNTQYRLLAKVFNITGANGNVILEVTEQNGASPQTYSLTVPLSSITNDTLPIVFTTSGDCTSVTISIKPDDATAVFDVDFISLFAGNELIIDPDFTIQAGGSQIAWTVDDDYDIIAGEAHYDGGGGFDTLSLNSSLWLDTSTSYTLRVTIAEVANSSGVLVGRVHGDINTILTELTSVTAPETLSGAEIPATSSSSVTILPSDGTANFRVTEISLKPTE